MKKIISLILVMCFALGCLAACGSTAETTETIAPEVTDEVIETVVDEVPAIEIQEVDFDKLYAAVDPQTVVMTVDGNDITWDEYFYMVYAGCQEIMSYFSTMASYYGIAINWGDSMGEGYNMTYADYVSKGVENSLISLMTISGNAAANKVELSQENLDAIAAQLQNDILYMCGENATEEDFNQSLKNMYMTRVTYDKINRINYLYQEAFVQIFGAVGEKVSDEDAIKYLEDNGYMSSDHILLATIDLSTQQPLEDSVIAEKKAQAEEIVATLSAIKDKDKLLEKFAELKNQYTEDTGAAYYPNGYIFTSGKMVPEFEEATKSQADYEVSGIVESSYGYHIIMTLPLDPDATVEYSSEGTAMNARMMFANNAYGEMLDKYAAAIEIQYAEGFVMPSLLDYLK